MPGRQSETGRNKVELNMNLIAGDAMSHLLIALAFVVTLIVPACVGSLRIHKKERTSL
jgi:hypothetical protein